MISSSYTSNLTDEQIENNGIMILIDRVFEGDNFDSQVDIFSSVQSFFEQFYSVVLLNDSTSISDDIIDNLYPDEDSEEARTEHLSDIQDRFIEALKILRKKMKLIIEDKEYISYLCFNPSADSSTQFKKPIAALCSVINTLLEKQKTVYYDSENGTNYATPISIQDGIITINNDTVTVKSAIKNFTTSTALTEVTNETLSKALFGTSYKNLSASSYETFVKSVVSGGFSNWVYIKYRFETENDGNITYNKGLRNKFTDKYNEFFYFTDIFLNSLDEDDSKEYVDAYLKKYLYSKKVSLFREKTIDDSSINVQTNNVNPFYVYPKLAEKFNGKAGYFKTPTTLQSAYTFKGKETEIIKLPFVSIEYNTTLAEGKTLIGYKVEVDDFIDTYGYENPYDLTDETKVTTTYNYDEYGNKTNQQVTTVSNQGYNFYETKMLPLETQLRPRYSGISTLTSVRKNLETTYTEFYKIVENYDTTRIYKNGDSYYYDTEYTQKVYSGKTYKDGYGKYWLKQLTSIMFYFETDEVFDSCECQGFFKIKKLNQTFLDNYISESKSEEYDDDEFRSFGDDRNISYIVNKKTNISNFSFENIGNIIYLKIKQKKDISEYDSDGNTTLTTTMNQFPYSNVIKVLVDISNPEIENDVIEWSFKPKNSYVTKPKNSYATNVKYLLNVYKKFSFMSFGIFSSQLNVKETFEYNNYANGKNYLKFSSSKYRKIYLNDNIEKNIIRNGYKLFSNDLMNLFYCKNENNKNISIVKKLNIIEEINKNAFRNGEFFEKKKLIAHIGKLDDKKYMLRAKVNNNSFKLDFKEDKILVRNFIGKILLDNKFLNFAEEKIKNRVLKRGIENLDLSNYFNFKANKSRIAKNNEIDEFYFKVKTEYIRPRFIINSLTSFLKDDIISSSKVSFEKNFINKNGLKNDIISSSKISLKNFVSKNSLKDDIISSFTIKSSIEEVIYNKIA